MGDPSATDAAIWSRAARPGWVLVSKDQDFADRALVLGPPPLVIHLTLGNGSTRDLLPHMERCWEPIVALVQDPEVSLITIERQAIGVHRRSG